MSTHTVEQQLAVIVGQVLRHQQWRCAVAESCTGGRLAAAITDIPGSSQWFDRGFVTYTNQSKMDLLDVPSVLLNTQGAVSHGTVCAMAEGGLHKSQADVVVAISGIAGPGGGSVDKPVGLVWIAWSGRTFACDAQSFCFKGDREAVRSQAVCAALEGLILRCRKPEESKHVR
jgi:PncC family amidohydrolase